jgi:hypothetical protein
MSRDSSVGIPTGYVSRDGSFIIAAGWTAGIQFLAGARDIFLLHSVQTGSGAHPDSCTVGTRGSFSGNKAAWA